MTVEITATPNTTATEKIRRLLRQDSGMLPVMLALVALVIYFQARNHVFLSASNIANLFTQAAIYVILGMAEVWLLLLGEIDLSLGWAAGMAGTIAGIYTNSLYGWPWPLAFAFALVVTTAIGFLNGVLVVKLRLPSFIVTLATMLGWQGILIYILDKVFEGGGVPIRNAQLRNIIQGNLTPFYTWAFLALVVVSYAGAAYLQHAKRNRLGLVTSSLSKLVAKVVVLAVVAFFLGHIFNTNRSTFITLNGMPFAVPLVVAVLALYSFILNRTRFGRYIYAIGGNQEAARRAGIPVDRFRVFAFMFGGVTAGIGGLVYISFLGGYSTSSTDQTIVLYAVAAAVIGGASLYGGRGKMVHAVVGGVILAVIANGMALLQLNGPDVYIVTGLILLAAVVVDSVSRRGQSLK